MATSCSVIILGTPPVWYLLTCILLLYLPESTSDELAEWFRNSVTTINGYA
ncbi:MAG: hypothetical protein JO297_19325 [Nitrososphaeraceae archaeon]|nr:hypothetical protein [Nitrososphaeraceae archaeon]